MNCDICVAGAGIFGVSTALELNRRGFKTIIVDKRPIPNPLASSTDISKIIRMEYGWDRQYMEMAEACITGWHQWNEELRDKLFHQTGVLMLTRDHMKPGGFEYESFQNLLQRGYTPERLNESEITNRFPAWKPGSHVDGFYHNKGGFAESGKVVGAVLEKAIEEGVIAVDAYIQKDFIEKDSKIIGVHTDNGQTIFCDHLVIATGAWTPYLVDAMAPLMNSTGHPVFHLKLEENTLFEKDKFPVFTADVARTGYYGFPVHPKERVMKIAVHASGTPTHPTNDERTVFDEDELNLRNFLDFTFPSVSNARVVYTRRCLYGDTLDEHFIIDHHPSKSGLTIATGGSGHGFKFGPIIGSLIADKIENKANPWLPKFKFRLLSPDTKGEEAARCHT